jgi:hypothetical protein
MAAAFPRHLGLLVDWQRCFAGFKLHKQEHAAPRQRMIAYSII